MEFLSSLFASPNRFFDPYYDNFGKYSSHFIGGTASLWLGDARGCSAINESRFCVLDLIVDLGKDETVGEQRNLRWGICVPTFCSNEVVWNNSKSIFDEFTSNLAPVPYKWNAQNVIDISCMDKTGPSKGYYAVLSLLILLLLWCFVSSLVVLRYKTRSRMRYSLVYRSGPRSLGVVEPHPMVHGGGGPSTVRGNEGCNNPGAKEGGVGVRPNSADCESSPTLGVEHDGVVADGSDGGIQSCQEEERKGLLHKEKVGNARKLGKRRKISEPPLPLPGGLGEAETLPTDAPGGVMEAAEGTFDPPSRELLRNAFRYRPGFWTEVCQLFSLESNLSNMAKERPNQVIGLDCLRVLSFWLLLLVQVYLFAIKFGIIANTSLSKERIIKLVTTHIIACYPLALDTLFFVSGFSSMLNYKKRKWNSLRYIVRRYLRLFVPLAFVLLIAMYLLPYWASYSGPQSFKFKEMSNQCSEHWWKTVLGIQNFMVSWQAEKINGCLQWTWVVANQWQQSIFLSLVFFCILNKTVIFFHIFLLVACLCSVASLIDILELNPNLIGYVDCQEAISKLNNYMNNILTKPYTFVAPFTIGVIASYKLFLDKSRPTYNDREDDNSNGITSSGRIVAAFRRRFDKKTCNCIGWIYCFLVLLGFFALNCAVLSAVPFSIAGHVFSGISFHLLWPLVLYWIIYSCCRGNGGFFSWFSSWKVWMYVDRLSYSAYLVHGLSLMYVCSAWTSVVEPEDQFSVFIIFSSSLMLTYLAALVLHLVVEAPLLKLLGHASTVERQFDA